MRRGIFFLLLLAIPVSLFAISRGLDLMDQGMADYKQGKYDDAIPKLTRAYELVENREIKASACLALGIIFQLLDDVSQAKVQFARAFVENPSLRLDRDFYSPKTVDLFNQAKQEGLDHLEKGKQLYKEAKWEDSLKAFSLGVKLLTTTSPEIDRVLIVDAYFTSAKIYQVLNQNDAAVREFEKALSLNPDLELDPELYSAPTIALFQKARDAGNRIVAEAGRMISEKNYATAIRLLQYNDHLLFNRSAKKEAAVLLAKAFYLSEDQGQASNAVQAVLTANPDVQISEKSEFSDFVQTQKQKRTVATPKILIVKGKENPAHDLAIRGFREELAGEIKETDVKNAASEMKSFAPNAIFVSGADTLNAVQKLGSSTPIVFVNVPRNETSRVKQNVGGIYWDIPLQAQFSFLKAMLPAAKRVGIFYSSEIAPQVINEAKQKAGEYGLELIARAVEDPEEFESAFRQMKDLDVFWMLQDKGVIRSQEASSELIRIAARKKIPVFAPHEAIVREQGALFSVSSNFQTMGRQAAQLTHKLLTGPAVDTMPVLFPTLSKLTINLKVAKQLGVEISPSAIVSATTVYR